MDKISVRWNANKQYVGWDSLGHGVVLDAPSSVGGENTGWRPIELVLLGIAGCSGMDITSILDKKREDYRNFEIFVEGEPEMDEYPHYYKNIHIHYVVTGVAIKPESVARAIELSMEKYCSVKGCLGSQCVVETSFEVRELGA